jgi:hypothetical protein
MNAVYHGFAAVYREFRQRRTGPPYALENQSRYPQEPNRYVIQLWKQEHQENPWVIECDRLSQPISGKSVYALMGEVLRSILALDAWEARKERVNAVGRSEAKSEHKLLPISRSSEVRPQA